MEIPFQLKLNCSKVFNKFFIHINHHQEIVNMQKFLKSSVLMSLALLGSSLFGASIDQLISAGEARINDGARAQKRIVALADETDNLIAEYKQTLKVVDGLNIYNGLQKKQIANQEAEKVNLIESVDKVADIERQIVPLMVNMIDSLKQFVAGDVPFLLDERNKRVQDLDDLMEAPDVAQAEMLRQVLQAYSIETDFGNTIESYKDKINIGGNELEVNFLRIGRIALAYQSDDGKDTGAWDASQKAFVPLSASDYKAHIDTGLKIARKEVSPDLFIIPVPAAEGAK